MKYTYQGPVDSGVTLKDEKGQETEVLLYRGTSVDLPEDNEYVKTLVALNHLVPDTSAPTGKPSRSTTAAAAPASESADASATDSSSAKGNK